MYGVLWRLTPADLAALDRFEGIADHFYRHQPARVRTPGGAEVDALIYRPTDDSPGIPTPGYLERIVAVGRLLGFPAPYIAGLQSLIR